MDSQAAIVPASGAILAAGGLGLRMGAAQPKQLLSLTGEPMLVHSCRALLAVRELETVVVVAAATYIEQCRQCCAAFLEKKQLARLIFTSGGSTRQDSVRLGLARLPPALSLVVVHDAARPLTQAELVSRCLMTAARYGAAISAVPVSDTLKAVDAASGIVQATVDRSRLWQAQTPQAVQRRLLLQAYEQADATGFQGTDEASVLEQAGIAVQVVEGSPQNMKITGPEDLPLAEALLRARKRERHGERCTPMRIGHGFDAHRLVPGRQLILGGVSVDYHLGLDGHSDADVVCHALSDALLGALGLGDIGRHFPDSDPAYKGADSLALLERLWQLASQRGFRLGNADITIVCQQPKLMPYLARMRENLARCSGGKVEQVNVKATTTEKMGYTGRGEGIAAHAVLLLEVVYDN